ncbi:MAG: lysophospholipid acyltransferase family protein [Candidatus Omnitrophica bacterium]|nr:lysophospholipid acyltransferase family protein [Candidatus Omnitrophota bacterium]
MKRKPYRYLLYILLKSGSLIILILPFRAAVNFGSFLGGAAYSFISRYREITLQNLRSVFSGQKSDEEIEKIAKDVFRNIGKTAVEFIGLGKFNRKNVKKLFVEEDYRPLLDLASKGSVIALAFHFGSWEMSAVGGVAFGLDVTVIGRRIYYPPYNDFLVSLRGEKGVKTLYRDEKNVLRKSMRILKEKNVLGVVPDQDVDSIDGVFVDFFGRKTHTPIGPVVMAMLSGAPMLPTFMVREGGKFRLFIDKPIYVTKTGDRERDIRDYTQKWTDVAERYIRKYPSHWVWMHKRWKTRPSDEQVLPR